MRQRWLGRHAWGLGCLEEAGLPCRSDRMLAVPGPLPLCRPPAHNNPAPSPSRASDLEIHLKTEQVHIAPASEKLASHRTTNGYRNYGERLYVEGRLEAMRKEQLVGLEGGGSAEGGAAQREGLACGLHGEPQIGGRQPVPRPWPLPCLQAQRAKEEEARAEVEACAFHPSISKLAHQIKVSEAELAPGTASAYQRLYQRGDGTAKRQVGFGGGRSGTTAVSRAGPGRAAGRACLAQPPVPGRPALLTLGAAHPPAPLFKSGNAAVLPSTTNHRAACRPRAPAPSRPPTHHPPPRPAPSTGAHGGNPAGAGRGGGARVQLPPSHQLQVAAHGGAAPADPEGEGRVGAAAGAAAAWGGSSWALPGWCCLPRCMRHPHHPPVLHPTNHTQENGLPGYEQLYHDSQRRRLKLEALAAVPHEEATFRPRINTSSVVLKKLMEGREAAGPLDAGSDDVAMRCARSGALVACDGMAARCLLVSCAWPPPARPNGTSRRPSRNPCSLLERGRKYQEKLQQAQREAEVAPRDASTGRLLFQPKTFRAPHYDRNPEGV